MPKCEQINDMGITVNSTFTPSNNILTAVNKTWDMLYFIKKIIYMSDEGNVCASIQRVGETTSRIRHISKMSLPQKGHIPSGKNIKMSEGS